MQYTETRAHDDVLFTDPFTILMENIAIFENIQILNYWGSLFWSKPLSCASSAHKHYAYMQ